jgi:hypothetical protein
MARLKSYERKLIAMLLDLASDQYSNHGCNDFDLSFLPDKERQSLLKAIEEWNGTPEDYDPTRKVGADWVLMRYLGEKIDPESEQGAQS